MAEYARKTKVSPSQSREEIEATLKRYGATAFGFAWDADRGFEIVQFRLNGREIRLSVRKPHAAEPKIKEQIGIAQRRTELDVVDSFHRQRWRALNLYVKAICEAISEEVVTVDEAFLFGIVMPDGRTMADHSTEQLQKYLLEGRLPPLLTG